MPTVTSPIGIRTEPRPARRGPRRPVRLLSLAAAVAALVVSLAVVIPGDGDRAAPDVARPALQRVLEQLTSGPGRIAPGATAYVAGPQGTWLGAAGIADLSDGRPMPPTPGCGWRASAKDLDRGAGAAARRARTARAGRHRGSLAARAAAVRRPDHAAQAADPHQRHLRQQRRSERPCSGARSDQGPCPALRAEFVRWQQRIDANPATQFPPTVWIRLAATQPLYFPPGTGYHYSNVGFEVLGLVIETVTGRPLATAYRDQILAPLGLRQTAYDPQGDITGAHPRAYALNLDGSMADRTAVHPGIGAEGGVVSTARETATFLTALMQGKLLGPAALAGMKERDFWSGGDVVSGVGTAYGHSGAGSAYKADVLVDDDGVALPCCSSTDVPRKAPATPRRPAPSSTSTAPPDLGLAAVGSPESSTTRPEPTWVDPRASAKCGFGWIVGCEDRSGWDVEQARTPAIVWLSRPMTRLEARARPRIIPHRRHRPSAGRARRARA